MVGRDFGQKLAAVHQKHAPSLGGVALTDTQKQPAMRIRCVPSSVSSETVGARHHKRNRRDPAPWESAFNTILSTQSQGATFSLRSPRKSVGDYFLEAAQFSDGAPPNAHRSSCPSVSFLASIRSRYGSDSGELRPS